MVSAREALIDGGLDITTPRAAGSGTPRTDRVLPASKTRPRVRATSRGLRKNALPERTAAAARYDIRPDAPQITRRQLAESIAVVRALRPALPVRSIVGDTLTAGLEAVKRDGGYLIGCVSDKHWTRGLNLAAFPEGVTATVYGPNGIMIRPAASA